MTASARVMASWVLSNLSSCSRDVVSIFVSLSTIPSLLLFKDILIVVWPESPCRRVSPSLRIWQCGRLVLVIHRIRYFVSFQRLFNSRINFLNRSVWRWVYFSFTCFLRGSWPICTFLNKFDVQAWRSNFLFFAIHNTLYSVIFFLLSLTDIISW